VGVEISPSCSSPPLPPPRACAPRCGNSGAARRAMLTGASAPVPVPATAESAEGTGRGTGVGWGGGGAGACEVQATRPRAVCQRFHHLLRCVQRRPARAAQPAKRPQSPSLAAACPSRRRRCSRPRLCAYPRRMMQAAGLRQGHASAGHRTEQARRAALADLKAHCPCALARAALPATTTLPPSKVPCARTHRSCLFIMLRQLVAAGPAAAALYGTGGGGWWRGPKDEPPIGG
jgi:hypothetical protein